MGRFGGFHGPIPSPNRPVAMSRFSPVISGCYWLWFRFIPAHSPILEANQKLHVRAFLPRPSFLVLVLIGLGHGSSTGCFDWDWKRNIWEIQSQADTSPPKKSQMEPPPPTALTAAPPPLLRRLSAVDASLSRLLHRHNFLPRSLFLLLELSADFRLFFPVSLSLYLSPVPSLRPLLAPLILGLLLDLALVGLVKLVFRRPRPVYNENMSVAVSVDHYSFPSGHASRVCFVAALVHLSAKAMEGVVIELRSSGFVDRWIAEGSERKSVELVVLVASVWAAATAGSRVLLGRHYACDVFAGACLGVIEGWLAYQYLRL